MIAATGRCPYCRARNCLECQPVPETPPPVYRYSGIFRLRAPDGSACGTVLRSCRSTSLEEARQRLLRRVEADFAPCGVVLVCLTQTSIRKEVQR